MSYRFVKLMKHMGDCPTMLVEDESGRKYVQKLLDDTQFEIYSLLTKDHIRGIPGSHFGSVSEMVLPDFMEALRAELSQCTKAVLFENYIEGSDLEQLLEKGGRMKLLEFHKMMYCVCDTMKKVHALGIVHRDLKPANIIRADDGRYFIIDFGIARVTRRSSTNTAIVATLGYASPEQLEGKRATVQSDIYALGRLMKQFMPNLRGYRKVVSKAAMDSPKERYNDVGEFQKAVIAALFCPIGDLFNLIIGLGFWAIIGGLLIFRNYSGLQRWIDKQAQKQELSSAAPIDVGKLSDEKARLLALIENGDTDSINYLRLSEIYELEGSSDEAANILIEYVDSCFDRRLYESGTPVYERLEELKVKTSTDTQLAVSELNLNADYIDKLLNANEYDRAKEVLDSIEESPCRVIEKDPKLLYVFYYDYYICTKNYAKASEMTGKIEELDKRNAGE